MKKLSRFLVILVLSLVFVQCSDDDSTDNGNQVQTLSDADGNVYKTITIGKQTWMVENLKTTKYNDGTPITEYTFATHNNNWMNLNTPTAFYQWADTSDLNEVID